MKLAARGREAKKAPKPLIFDVNDISGELETRELKGYKSFRQGGMTTLKGSEQGSSRAVFDPLLRFAEIERLVAKVYFRFSLLFIDQPELRDFWWEMAKQEEQHATILIACKGVIQNYPDESMDPSITREKADRLRSKLDAYLGKATPSIGVDEAFKIALEIESSEIDVIYSKLLHLGGPKIAKAMADLGVPASVQRHKLKSALRRFSKNSKLLQAAERL